VQTGVEIGMTLGRGSVVPCRTGYFQVWLTNSVVLSGTALSWPVDSRVDDASDLLSVL
jgi:hypothetical protein